MLVAASLVPALLGMGWLYASAAVVGGAYLLAKSVRLAAAPNRSNALVNFHASLAQLTILLVGAIADAALHA
jgi:heme O synthase-like polyprenyltransferase